MTDVKDIAAIIDLVPDDLNANAGTERGMFALQESVLRFGVGRGVVVDKHGKVIGGNKTLATLADLGGYGVQVVRTAGDTLVINQRVDLDLDDPDDALARELAFADNRVQELNLAWDAQQVAASANLDLGAFFHQHELDAIIAGAEAAHEDIPDAPEVDPVPEMEIRPFEHYDAVVICFRNTWDWAQAVDLLGIEKRAFSVQTSKGHTHRKIGLCRVLEGGAFLERMAELRASSDSEPEAG